MNLEGKIVLVLGGQSMIGRAVTESLKARNAVVFAPDSASYDARDVPQLKALFDKFTPQVVYNGLGFNGGIKFNRERPADIYHTTLLLNTNVLSLCKIYRVEKVISPLPSCAYAAFKNGVLREELVEKEFADGPPHPSVECHGLAKRIAFDLSRLTHKQYGVNAVCVVLNNCFGPGFRSDPDRRKVAESLIVRFVDAVQGGLPEVEIWGDGTPRREFIYSGDAGEGIVRALERYDEPDEVLNIGRGEDVSIGELALEIAKVVGFKGEVKFLSEMPNGQMRKLLNVEKMGRLLEWVPPTSLTESVLQTAQWYASSK